MSDEVFASVRFQGSGFDVLRVNSRFVTRQISSGALCVGSHDEAAAMQLLADLALLADERRTRIALASVGKSFGGGAGHS